MSGQDFQLPFSSSYSGAEFLEKVHFFFLSKSLKEKGSSIEQLFAIDEEVRIALNQTGIQDSVSVINAQQARTLASILIDEEGNISYSHLEGIIDYLTQNLSPIGPDRSYETLGRTHFLKVLKELKSNAEVLRIIKGIGKPIANPHADQLIRDTLRLPGGSSITDVQARRASLAAWLTRLRQSVGSCFATAPAIIIHDEQPARFLSDIRDLLGSGRLKRTFSGIEYAFPLSPSWGMGDLRRPFYADANAAQAASAPGFIQALVEVDVINQSLSYVEKSKKSRAILQAALQALKPNFKGGIVTCEALLRIALLWQIGLTEQDLLAFHERPRNMMQERLLGQVSKQSKKLQSKGEKIAFFQLQLKTAESAFKSLTENALLKSWEFTIASFAEAKADFAKWNLYQSLGMEAEMPNGIGQCVYRFLEEKLKVYRKQIQEIQSRYEMLFLQLKSLEGRMKDPRSEAQMQWMRVDYDGRYNEFLYAEEQRDEMTQKANRLTQVFPFLMKMYIEKFPAYFQEIYDAEMQEVTQELHDDSPAGFRLLCKHGRSNPATWSMIYTPEQYIDSLAEFFSSTENEISTAPELEGLRNEFSLIVTEIIRHLRTKDFLESSFHRIALAHETTLVANPLENLQKISKKPWAYTSGGTMGTLVSCVYSREQPPAESSKWVESESELFAFYLDTLKSLPYLVMKPYQTDPCKSMLGYSPTHGFVIKPGLSPFLHGWQEEAYTFSWIRDTFTEPARRFYNGLRLSQSMIYALIDRLSNLQDGEYQHLIKRTLENIPSGVTPREFRETVLKLFSEERWVKRIGGFPFRPAFIDQLLYQTLPLFPFSDLTVRLQAILDRFPPEEVNSESVMNLYQQVRDSFMTPSLLSSEDLREITKGLIALSLNRSQFKFDLHAEVTIAMQKLGFSAPAPFLFADSNWVRDFFGFIVNPGTEDVELWRLDYTGGIGTPIPEWKKWLNGSNRKPWGLYTRPFEYGQ